MAALAEIVGSEALTFMGLPLPLTLKLPLPMTNDQLLAFSREHQICLPERRAEAWFCVNVPGVSG